LVLARAAGREDDPVQPKAMPKGLSRSRKLKHDNQAKYIASEILELCQEMVQLVCEEEHVHHGRNGTKFKIEAESWHDHHPNFSHSFAAHIGSGVGMKMAMDKEAAEMADAAIKGLRENGFMFGTFFAKRITLRVIGWTDVPKKFEIGALISPMTLKFVFIVILIFGIYLRSP
jgi:hypothetical protein